MTKKYRVEITSEERQELEALIGRGKKSSARQIRRAHALLAGLAGPSVFTTVMGLLQFSTPPEMRARVMSFFNMVSFGMQPVAALWIGWGAAHFGIPEAVLLGGFCLLVGALIMLSRSSLRQWLNVPHVSTAMHLSEAGD